MTEEGKVQKAITAILRNDGWFVLKLMQTSRNGIPDLLAVLPGRNLWVEVKTTKGHLSKLQEQVIEEITNPPYFQSVIVAYGVDDFENKYKILNDFGQYVEDVKKDDNPKTDLF
jgi:hypothetical protein